MNISIQKNDLGRINRVRASALAVAATVTFLVFAAINAGFTPHGADLAADLNDPAGFAL